MNQAYFEKWSELAKKIQEPMQSIAELNIKTLKNMSYIKPEELTHLRKPEELFEKQVNLAVENGHKALDYLEESFRIMEKAVLSFTKEMRAKADAVAKK